MRYEELDEASARQIGVAGMIGSAAIMGGAGATLYKDMKAQQRPASYDSNAMPVFGDGDWFGDANRYVADAPAQSDAPRSSKDSPPQLPSRVLAKRKEAAILALTIWGEARAHGSAGMNAVGHVIMNRARSGKFGEGIQGVALRDKAFSCWNAGDPNRAQMINITNLKPGSKDYDAWVKAKKIATEIVMNKTPDPTGGALFYHTDAVNPNWAKPSAFLTKINNHIFYKSAKTADDLKREGLARAKKKLKKA